MSNWRMQKTEVLSNVESPYLEEAFAAMGYSIDTSVKTVQGAYRSDGSQNVDCVLIDANGKNTEIGLKFEEGPDNTVAMYICSDWWNKKTNPEDFQTKFQLEYITAQKIALAKKEGFEVVRQEETSMETRRLVLRRAA